MNWKNKFLSRFTKYFLLISLFFGVAAASAAWQGTAWILTGESINSVKLKANFDYLYSLWKRSANNLFYLDGNVGIGTTNPSAKLHIIGANNPIPFRINNSFSIDSVAGTGLANLVAGAVINNTGTGYNFLTSRGASRIVLHDGYIGFLTSNSTTGTAGSHVDGLDLGQEKMSILNNGNVGIGTTGPVRKLHIKEGNLLIENSQVSTVNVNKPALELKLPHNTYPGNETAIRIEMDGDGDINGNGVNDGDDDVALEVLSRAAPSDTLTAKYILWSDGDMFVGGNVGIGTTTPNRPLTIENGSILLNRPNDPDGGWAGLIEFAAPGSIAPANSTTFRIIHHVFNTGSKLQFRSFNDDGSNKAMPLNLTHDGKVGIGVISPYSILHVIGDGRFNMTDNQTLDINSDISTDATNYGVLDIGMTNTGGSANHKALARFALESASTQDIQAGIRVIDNSSNADIDYGLYISGGLRNYFAGNVGIGTTNPSSKLEVAGNVEANAYCDRNGQNCLTSGDIYNLVTGVSGDNLGNHIATQNLQMAGNWINGDAGNGGIRMSTTGQMILNSESSLYDLWIQGGASTAASTDRNLAFLGYDNNSGDYLYINYNGEYTRGVRIGSSLGINVLPTTGTFNNGKAIALGDNDTGIRQDGDGILELWTNNAERVHIAANGNVGIGTTSPNRKLHVKGSGYLFGLDGNGTANKRNYSFYQDSDRLRIIASNDSHGYVRDLLTFKHDGNIGIGTNAPSAKLDVNGNVKAVSYLYSSDRRLKTDIKTLDGLKLIDALRGVSFKWKESGEKSMGLIAQEVEKVAPELVKTDKNTGLKSVLYGNLVAPLIEAVKELHQALLDIQDKLTELFANDLRQDKEIQELKARLNEQEKIINELKNKLAE